MPSLIPDSPPGWWEALEREARRETARRAYYERHHKDQMTYREFVMRCHLHLDINQGRMGVDRAREIIKEQRERERSDAAGHVA